MLRRHYSLILMAVWLFIAACLIAPDQVLPENLRRHFDVPGGSMAGALAIVFAVYNLVRWWSYQSLYQTRGQRAAENPLAVRKLDETEPYQPNPELNFLQVPDANRPPPRNPPSGES